VLLDLTMERLVASFSRDFQLSERERTVLLLAALGRSTKETCLAMDCEVTTVNVYWLRIRKKTGRDSRLGVIALLLERALYGPASLRSYS
jgi:DNA-binding CsgD family transcriptional regulator